MLAAYRARDWDSTNRLLDEWGAQAEALGLGMLYAMYRERVAQLQSAPPPDDWDGVFAANEK
jgi:adenylate cyclase